MCNGSIMDKLISFALPLMLSGVLQLMFNAVDIIVVGRFSGSQALAAVGSTTALIAVFTNFFIGISRGANVLGARFYAAGRDKEMSETVHTAITLALISGIAIGFIFKFFYNLHQTRNFLLLCLIILFLLIPGCFFLLHKRGIISTVAMCDSILNLIYCIDNTIQK